MNRLARTTSLALAVLSYAARASAGDEEPAAPPVIVVDPAPTDPATVPPQAYDAPPPAVTTTGDVYGPQTVSVQPIAAPVVVEPFSLPRLRYGFSILGGVTSVGGDHAGSASALGGASGRIGLQINRNWGVYLNEQGLIGGYILAGPDWTRTVVFLSANTSLLGSFIARDRLEIAFGPSFDALAAVSVDATTSTSAVGAYEGSAFGLHLRAAALLGRIDPMRGDRAGFSLSLEAHPTFFSGLTLVTICVGLGGDWY